MLLLTNSTRRARRQREPTLVVDGKKQRHDSYTRTDPSCLDTKRTCGQQETPKLVEISPARAKVTDESAPIRFRGWNLAMCTCLDRPDDHEPIAIQRLCAHVCGRLASNCKSRQWTDELAWTHKRKSFPKPTNEGSKARRSFANQNGLTHAALCLAVSAKRSAWGRLRSTGTPLKSHCAMNSLATGRIRTPQLTEHLG